MYFNNWSNSPLENISSFEICASGIAWLTEMVTHKHSALHGLLITYLEFNLLCNIPLYISGQVFKS